MRSKRRYFGIYIPRCCACLHTLSSHLRLVDGDARLGVEELGLQSAVDALVVLALCGDSHAVRGGVLHLERSLQAVVIAEDVCCEREGGSRITTDTHNTRHAREMI